MENIMSEAKVAPVVSLVPGNQTDPKPAESLIQGRSWRPGDFSTGETPFDMFYNAVLKAGNWGGAVWRDWGTDPVKNRRKELQNPAKSHPQKFAELIKEIKIGCTQAGQTGSLLLDWFGEGKPLEAYLSDTDVVIGDLMQAVENSELPQNVTLLGKLNDAAYSYSDNVRDTILPLMSDTSISLERKVVELNLLASLDNREECSSTVLEAVITCFNQLSPDDQNTLLVECYEDLEGAPLQEFQKCEDIDNIRGTILGEFIETADSDVMDFARIESMQFYGNRNQPSTVRSLYKQLSEETKGALAIHETTAQKREAKDSRPIPGVGDFTYFKADPTGAFVKQALEAFITDQE